MMKKLVTLLFPVLLCGCTGGSTVQQTNESQPNAVITRIPFPSYKQLECAKFNFEGHRYILFNLGSGKYATGGVVHDPWCPKCKKMDGRE